MQTDQVVERLRASYEETRLHEDEDGHAAGVRWASQSAEYAELVWMERTGKHAADALYHWRIEDSPLEHAYGRPEDLWESYTPERQPSRAWVAGFVEGALEVFERVKDQFED